MMLDRQKRLLALLDALGGKVGRMDFQKLLFLYCMEIEVPPSYDFVPYRYGGFSFTSYADKRRLAQAGYLTDEDTWKLTKSGKAAAKVTASLKKSMNEFSQQYEKLQGEALVTETYRRYPYYAIRSRMANRLLSNDNKALRAVQASRPAASIPGLCTIGYEGLSLENFLNKLLRDGVNLLCDVRRNPISRKYGFSKTTLRNACEGVDIHYEHLPELGIASEDRKDLTAQADYDALFEIYKREHLPLQEGSLSKILSWISSGKRVALTCYEQLPFQCHRHCVAEVLEKSKIIEYKTMHL